MRVLSYLRSVGSKFFQADRGAAELDQEVQFHIQQRADDLERSGLNRAEAERRARVEFGGMERFKEEAREEEASK